MKTPKQLPQKGEFIRITARKCGALQKHIQTGDTYSVVKSIKNADGVIYVTVANAKTTRKTMSINSHRFDWRVMTTEDLAEERLRKDSEHDAQRMSREFTPQEQMRVGMVPLIYNYIAWTFALRAVSLGVQYRVEILKKITRAIRELQREYERVLSLDLDRQHQKHIESETNRFMDQYAYNFTILYWSVNSYFKKVYPNYPYDDLRTNAVIALMIIRLVDEHNRETDKFIASRFGSCKASLRMPTIDKLYTCMEAFAGIDSKFDFNEQNMQLNMQIIKNKINEIEFNFV